MSLPMYGNYETNQETTYLLKKLFVTIEKHILESHIPPEVTSQILGGDVRYDFQGICVLPETGTFSYRIRCSCGKCWSIGSLELRECSNWADPIGVMHRYCEAVNDKYINNREIQVCFNCRNKYI